MAYGVNGRPDVSAKTSRSRSTGQHLFFGTTRKKLSSILIWLDALTFTTFLGLVPPVLCLEFRQQLSNRRCIFFFSAGTIRADFSPDGWSAIVDYAHTPDALEKCLNTIRDVLPAQGSNKIITVFGAGGDRDKTKRLLWEKLLTR